MAKALEMRCCKVCMLSVLFVAHLCNTMLVLFANVESSLQNNTPDSSVQIELCLKFLSSVRSISQVTIQPLSPSFPAQIHNMYKKDLTNQSQDGTEYHAWCKHIVNLFDNYPRLRHHQRLSFVLDLISRL